MITENEIKEMLEQDNSSDYPQITNALDASARLLLTATKNSGLENPDISTILNIYGGGKYVLKFERVDLD